MQSLLKIKYFVCLILLGTSIPLCSQNYSLRELHSEQKFHLNGTARTDLGLGDNRTYLAVELPPNTKEWYFSFSATLAENNRPLNLFRQLASLYDQTGTLALAIESIVVPEGDIRANIQLTDFQNAMAFKNGQKFNYWPSASRLNYSEGIVKVTGIRAGTVFICLTNPNTLDGMTLSMEVTAMVSDKSDQEQAWEDLGKALDDLIGGIQENKKEKEAALKREDEWRNYWNTGWVLFENNQFDESIIYTQKAIDIANHPGLYFNRGIAKWAKDSTDCLPDYLKGLNMIYDLKTKEEAILVLEGGLKDIRDTEERIIGFKRHISSYALLENKLNEIKEIENWERKK